MEVAQSRKKTIIERICMVVALVIAGLMMFGCGTIGNGKLDSPITAYDAGWMFVSFDIATKPFQPTEVVRVTDVVYDLAQIDYANPTGLLDEFVKNEIERLYPDQTAEFRQMVFNIYQMGKLRIEFQIRQNPDIPRLKILDDFKQGISDALMMYNGSTTSKADIDELINDMEAVE